MSDDSDPSYLKEIISFGGDFEKEEPAFSIQAAVGVGDDLSDI